MEINWLKVPQWDRHDGLLHGFIGRRGGKSAGAQVSKDGGNEALTTCGSRGVCRGRRGAG